LFLYLPAHTGILVLSFPAVRHRVKNVPKILHCLINIMNLYNNKPSASNIRYLFVFQHTHCSLSYYADNSARHITDSFPVFLHQKTSSNCHHCPYNSNHLRLLQNYVPPFPNSSANHFLFPARSEFQAALPDLNHCFAAVHFDFLQYTHCT